MKNNEKNRDINRNAFIADLMELNQSMNAAEEVVADYPDDHIKQHFEFSLMYIKEGFTDEEIIKLVKLFCPTNYKRVLKAIDISE